MRENPYEPPKIPADAKDKLSWNRELTAREYWLAAAITFVLLLAGGLVGGFLLAL